MALTAQCAGWNFTEGGVFGAALSGTPAKGLLNAPLHGPDALTGGEFGPEASPATVAVCLSQPEVSTPGTFTPR